MSKVKNTQIKLEIVEDIKRSITIIEMPFELQLQIMQDYDDSWIDLQLEEVLNLHNELFRFLKERGVL